MSFVAAERLSQGAHFARSAPDSAGHGGAGYRLTPADFLQNLAPAIRDNAAAYFIRYGITWHQHANHGLSSQVCCLNFFMPLATRPDLLARVIGGALGIAAPKMLKVEEGPSGAPWFVGFEWTGRADYLNEWPQTGRATRGANATSADAIVRFEHEGRVEALLIEWKYTEAYGSPLSDRRSADGKSGGNVTRTQRYADLVFDPAGPNRGDLGLTVEDFFWEPLYQMLRQQTLAHRMQQAAEDGADRVRVLHISPAANRDLHKVTAPKLRAFGDDVFEAFAGVLVRPQDFIARSTEQVFGSLLAEQPDDPWAAYLSDRYGFLEEPS